MWLALRSAADKVSGVYRFEEFDINRSSRYIWINARYPHSELFVFDIETMNCVYFECDGLFPTKILDQIDAVAHWGSGHIVELCFFKTGVSYWIYRADPNNEERDIVCIPDSDYLAVITRRTVEIFHLPSPKPVAVIPTRSCVCANVEFFDHYMRVCDTIIDLDSWQVVGSTRCYSCSLSTVTGSVYTVIGTKSQASRIKFCELTGRLECDNRLVGMLPHIHTKVFLDVDTWTVYTAEFESETCEIVAL